MRRKEGRQEAGTLPLGDGRGSNMEEKILSERTVGRGPPERRQEKGAHREG